MGRDDLVVWPGVYPVGETPTHTTVMNLDEFLRLKAYAIDES